MLLVSSGREMTKSVFKRSNNPNLLVIFVQIPQPLLRFTWVSAPLLRPQELVRMQSVSMMVIVPQLRSVAAVPVVSIVHLLFKLV